MKALIQSAFLDGTASIIVRDVELSIYIALLLLAIFIAYVIYRSKKQK